MTFADFFIYGTYIAVALVASMTTVLICAIFLHAAGKLRQYLFVAIFILLAMYGMTEVAFSGVRFFHQWPTRLVLLILFTCCAAAIAARILGDRVSYEPKMFVPLLGLFCFYIFSVIFPALFGYRPYFNPRVLYPAFVILGLFMSFPKDFERVILSLKVGLAIVVLGSLASSLVMPDLAVLTNYVGLIHGFRIRLNGLTTHANILGPVALTLLMIELAHPFSSRWLRMLVVVSSLVTISLTQSKTTIIAGLVAATIVFLCRGWQNFSYMKEWSAPSKRTSRIVVLSSLMLSLTGVLVLVIIFDWLSIRWDFISRTELGDIETATGRTLIWESAIWEGMKHPVFGYGPYMWDEARLRSIGWSYASHAHNQYFEVFSVGGWAGLIGCLVYLFILARLSFSVARETSGMSLGLFAILLVRSVTEVPLSVSSIGTGNFLSHLAFVFFLVVARECKSQGASTKTVAPVRTARTLLGTLHGKGYGS